MKKSFRSATLTVCTLLTTLSGSALMSSAAAPASPSAVSNSFAAVTRHLEPGGSLFLYLSTEAWLSGLSTKVGSWREFVLALPGMAETDKAGINQAFDVAARVVKNSGVEDITGIGLSGVQRANGLYRTKALAHHYPGRNRGFLWSLFGSQPHPIDALKYFPADTVVAMSSDFDLALLWRLIQEEVTAANIEQAKAGLDQLKQMVRAQTGVELDQILDSLAGTIVVVLSLDQDKRVTIPAGETTLEIPEPRLGFMVKVKNDTLFTLAEKPMQQHEQIIKVDKPGFRMRTIPLPLPFPVRPTVAQTEEYFILASQEGLVEEMLAVAQGERPSLQTTAEYKELAQGIPTQANHFSFVSRRFGRELQKILHAVLKAQEDGPPPALVDQFLGLDKVSLAVTSTTEEGFLMTANQSDHPGMLIAGPVLVAPTAIMAGMLLPALAKAKSRAQSINCVSNLKQIALAGRIYANDHNDRFPMSFIEMKDELFSPKILACPSDPNMTKATDWAEYDPENNLSYEFVAPGAGDGDADLVVFRCPVHGHEAKADGSVHMGEP